ncbi:MAG: FadR/GntR family transcriptional regulator [Sphaerochaetaceae bacterium]
MKPIKPSKIYEIIVEEIGKLIDAEHLKPGDKLPPEREIATLLSVSRTSVRQAISTLVAKGVLVSRQGDGTYVSDSYLSNKINMVEEFSKELADELISPIEISEARILIECESARLCAIRADQSILNRLTGLIKQYELHNYKQGHLDTINKNIHMTIAEGSGNSVYYILLNNLMKLMNSNLWNHARNLHPPMEEYSLEKHIQQHRDLVQAIVSRSPEEARKAMYHHISNIEEEMIMIFSETKSRK